MGLLQFVNHAGEVLEQGDVVVIAPRQPDMRVDAMPKVEVDLTDRAYDTAVCGIVHDLYTEHKPDPGPGPEPEREAARASGGSGRKRNHAKGGPAQAFTLEELETLDRTRIAPGQIGHLLIGGVCALCKADADIAPIKAGDLLTTSTTKGHAQKVIDPSQAMGAVLGKALGSLKKGKGTIPVLLTLD